MRHNLRFVHCKNSLLARGSTRIAACFAGTLRQKKCTDICNARLYKIMYIFEKEEAALADSLK